MLQIIQRRKFDPKEDFSTIRYKDTEMRKLLLEIGEEAKRNGTSEMTLEEINAEIYAARREREAREAQGIQ
ncbi:MAG: hypothetical protein IJ685_02515 [Selenomonadaceae bacterium]|nr:hypothetical protein [Selenomonadaceae bacterium]